MEGIQSTWALYFLIFNFSKEHTLARSGNTIMLKIISDNFQQHATKIPAFCDGMKAFDLKHLLFVDSGLSCDTFNIIYIHRSDVTKEELVEALNYFRLNKLDYCIWVNQESLCSNVESLFKSFNIEEKASEVGMALDLKDYQSISDEKYENIKSVKDSKTLATYANIIAKNWTPADQNILSYYEKTVNYYLDPDNGIQLLIYYHDGQPVSCVELFPSDSKTVGFYGFATLEKYRGMGIGTTLLTFALNMAKDLGFKNAILQGTKDGLNIYMKFGFKDYTTYYEFA
ncbi:GNAT family N-acetyltransferase [Ekhidna sp.]